MSDLHEEIGELEAELEALSEALERCRKIAMGAQAAIAVGGLLLILLVTGVFQLGAATLVIAIAAILGGVALHGSNRSTRDQIVSTVRIREAERAERIDALDLQQVQGG